MDAAVMTILIGAVSSFAAAVFKHTVIDRIKLLEGKLQNLEDERQVDKAVMSSHHTFRRTVLALARQKDQVKSSAITELDDALEIELHAELEARLESRQKKQNPTESP